MRHDLIVVGAGPAGGSAACMAARMGLRVLLVEKHSMPRHKTCGGGVPTSLGRFLPGIDLPDGLLKPIARMRHSWRFGDAVDASMHEDGESPRLWSVRRSDFDAALAGAAHAAGAMVLDGVAVRDIEVSRQSVRVSGTAGRSGSSWSAEADYVIAADGATGPISRRLGIAPVHRTAIAAEIEVESDVHATRSLPADTFHLEYGILRNGYAWAFPKQDHINIGAGFFGTSQEPRGSHVRATIEKAIMDFAAVLGMQHAAACCAFHFHPIPIWQGRGPRHHRSGRVLLAGDAACLVNPLFGDGILNAVRSGVLAAMCIAEGDGSSYSRRLQRELGQDLDASARIARVFYAFAELGFRRGIKRPTATRIAAQLLNGELHYSEIAGRAIRRLLTPAARLGT